MRKFFTIALIILLILGLTISVTLAVVFAVQNNNSTQRADDLQAEVTSLRQELEDQLDPTIIPTGTPVPSSAPTEECVNRAGDGMLILVAPCIEDTIGPMLNLTILSSGTADEVTVVVEDDSGEVVLDRTFPFAPGLESYTVITQELDIPSVESTTGTLTVSTSDYASTTGREIEIPIEFALTQ